MADYPNDPATAFALDARAGRVVLSQLNRLSCERHLRDLDHAAQKGLVWNAEEAQLACDFFPTVLCLPEETDADEDAEMPAADVEPGAGRPFVLSPHQQFIVGSLFGWYAERVGKRSGVRRLETRFRIAYFEGAKGCGKTPLFAGILIYMLIRHGVRGAQLFCAAVTLDQAKLAFRDCERMVQASPALRAMVDQKVNNLAVLETGSFIRPISAERRGLDGKRVQGALVDELHEAPSNVVVVKIRAGIKGRPNALVLLPTNSGFDLESVCWEYHEYSREVLQGTVVNEAWFAFVCHLDACARCQKAGKLQPSDDCPDCDDWKTEGPHWLKANPNIGVSLPWQYLREQVREAMALPSQRNMVRRLNFCQWTQQATVGIPIEQWAACRSKLRAENFRTLLQGRACYLGIDLSDKIDLSSVVAIFPREMARDLSIEQAGERVTVDRAIDVLPFFWMPKKSLQRRAQEDKVPYVEWEKDGFLTATNGSMVDHDAIVDFIITVLAKEFQIKAIGIDQSGASAVITRLRRHFGEEFVIEVPQGFRRLNTPTRMIEALVSSQNLTHDGNPLMGWCIGNMAFEENSWREIRPVKLGQRKRIDGGVALIDAEAVMLEKPPEPESVYMTRGVKSLADYLADGDA